MTQATYSDREFPREANVIEAMWRHRFVVIVVAAVVVGVAALYGASRPRQYVAEASLLVQPPTAASGANNPGRYVADQVAILRSATVARRASDIAATELRSRRLSEHDLLGSTDITAAGDSDLITVRYTGTNAALAATGANAIGKAYSDVRRSQVAGSSTASRGRLDTAIAALDQRLADLNGQKAATIPADPRGLAIADEQQKVLDQRAQLVTRREQLNVDAELAGTDVIFFPADTPKSSNGTALPRLLAVALAVGLMAGGGIAYVLAVRRRRFDSRAELEDLVTSPLLGEIPDFSSKRASDPIPARGARGSAASEAFRFAASTLNGRATAAGATSVMVVSGRPGDGKSTFVANAAVAAALDGASVLVVDADPATQTVTRVFGLVAAETDSNHRGSDTLPNGLSMPSSTSPHPRDIATREDIVDLQRGVRVARLGGGIKLDILALGGDRADASPFRSIATRRFFEVARRRYDLILIDTPALLHDANAAAVAALSDGAVVIVPGHGDLADLDELSLRLALLGTHVLGFVYNTAPRRARRRPMHLPDPVEIESLSEETAPRTGASHR